jgi:hypothetical protein
MSAPPVTDAPHLLNLCHLFDETHNSISLYALSLRLRTSSGTVYPIAHETWTNDAGFGPLLVEPLSAEPSLTLLTCRMA